MKILKKISFCLLLIIVTTGCATLQHRDEGTDFLRFKQLREVPKTEQTPKTSKEDMRASRWTQENEWLGHSQSWLTKEILEQRYGRPNFVEQGTVQGESVIGLGWVYSTRKSLKLDFGVYLKEDGEMLLYYVGVLIRKSDGRVLKFETAHRFMPHTSWGLSSDRAVQAAIFYAAWTFIEGRIKNLVNGASDDARNGLRDMTVPPAETTRSRASPVM